MALFGKKKEEQAPEASQQKTTEEKKQSKGGASASNYARILSRPHITEKAAALAEQNAYTFQVPQDANKQEITKAIRSIYNVTPQKVRITNLPPKQVVTRRGEEGVQSGLKKAVVYLKKGDRIEFV